MRQKRPELVGDGRNTISTGLVVHGRKLVLPEHTDLFVGDLLHHLPSKAFPDEEFGQVAQISLCLLQERQDAVAQQMLHARSPGIRPLGFEGLNQARCDERSMVWPRLAPMGCIPKDKPGRQCPNRDGRSQSSGARLLPDHHAGRSGNSRVRL